MSEMVEVGAVQRQLDLHKERQEHIELLKRKLLRLKADDESEYEGVWGFKLVMVHGGLQCTLRTARPSARTTDLPVPNNFQDSGPSARCSSRGHPVSLRVGKVEVSAEVSGGSS